MANLTLTSPKGFRVSAAPAGIKQSGLADLGLIVADAPCTAAATFTTNRIVAPSVVIDRQKIRPGRAQAIFVNAGNANACTGNRGQRDVHTICRCVSDQLGVATDDVLVCQTGIIGKFLPMTKIKNGIATSAASLSRSARAGRDLARAIMTTDTKPKQAHRQITLSGRTATLAGIAKGAGMVAPNMATVLVFVTCDVDISKPLLRRVWQQTTAQTFNKLSIDGHASTNDTAIILASGLAQNRPIRRSGPEFRRFQHTLWSLCDDLAQQLAADGEGATCAVVVRVRRAARQSDATAAVRAIVDSPLVRCAFNGADPNWGRIVSAVGYSQARIDPSLLACRIAGTWVFRKGRPCTFDAAGLSRKMKAKSWAVEVDLGLGRFEDFCYTCDMSRDYVAINADYHT